MQEDDKSTDFSAFDEIDSRPTDYSSPDTANVTNLPDFSKFDSFDSLDPSSAGDFPTTPSSFDALDDQRSPYEMKRDEVGGDNNGFWAGFGSLVMQGGDQLDKASSWLLEKTGFDGEDVGVHAEAEKAVNTYDPGAAVRSKPLDYVLNKFNNHLGVEALNKSIKFGVQASSQGADDSDPFVKAGKRASKYLNFIQSTAGKGTEIAGTTTYASLRDQVKGMPHEVLMDRSQRYREQFAATDFGDSPMPMKERVELAKSYLADQITSKAGWEAGLTTEVIGDAATTEWEKLLGPSGKTKSEPIIAPVDPSSNWVEDRVKMVVGGFAKQAGGLLKAAADVPEYATPFLPGFGVALAGFGQITEKRGITDALIHGGEALQVAASKNKPTGTITGWLTELTDASLNMIPMLLVGGDAGLAVMGMTTFGTTYVDEIKKGSEPLEALYESAKEALYEVGPEKAFGFFDKFAGAAGVKDWLFQALREGGSEIVTSILEQGDEYIPGREVWPGWGEFIKRALYEGSLGVGMGGVLSAPIAFRKKADDSPGKNPPGPDASGGGFRGEDSRLNQSKITEQATKTMRALVETHGLSGEEANNLLDPIAETYANDDNFVETFADLRYIEENGKPRNKGDDLDLDQEPEFYVDEAGNKHPIEDIPKTKESGGAPAETASEINGETGVEVAQVAPTRDIDTAANEAAASPENELPEPTKAQIEAGNYKKGHLSLHGMRISVENPKGSVRKHADGETTLQDHYGDVKGTLGEDGDAIDVFVGDDAENPNNSVYVVDQVNENGSFDENKALLGYPSEEAAREAYNRNYDNKYDRIGSIKEMSIDEFKVWTKEQTEKNKATEPATEPTKLEKAKKAARVYQGRSKKGLTEFFNPDGVAWGTSSKGSAEIFADVKETHYPYAKPPRTEKEMRGDVYPLNFDLRNPMVVDIKETLWKRENELAKIKEAKKLGHDGLIITHPNGKKDYVAFDPSQVTRASPEAKTTELEQVKKSARKAKLEQTEPKKTLFKLRAAPQNESEAPLKKSKLKNGDPSVDANVVHFSNTPNLPKLLGSFYGTGVSERRGSERAAVEAQQDERIKKRVYFNVRQGGRVSVGESMVRGAPEHVYTGKINNLYDIKTDELGLIARGRLGEIGMNRIEGELLDRGYNGLLDSEDGRGVVLNGNVELAYQGTQGALQGALLAEPEVSGFLSTAEAGYGKQSDLYESISALSPKAKRAFHEDQAAVILHKDMRMDLLAEKLGVDRSLMKFGIGAYEGGLSAVMLVELDSAETADAYALAVKRIYQQDAVPWMRAVKEGEATRHTMNGVILTKKDGWSREDMEHLAANGIEGFTKTDSETVVFSNFTDMPLDKFDRLPVSATEALNDVTIESVIFEGEYHDQVGPELTEAALTEAVEASVGKTGSSDLLAWIRGRKAAAQQRAERFLENLPDESGNTPAREAYQSLVKARERGWSPERRKAQSERMKKLHAERRKVKEQVRKLFERRGADVDFDVDAAAAGAYTEDERQEAMVDYTMKGVGSKYFKRWFGKSQVVDSDGVPLVLYHGTTREFTSFDRDIHKPNLAHATFHANYFSTDPGFASEWGERDDVDGGKVMPVYIKAEKIFDFRNKNMRRSFKRHMVKLGRSEILVKLDMKRVARGDWTLLETDLVQGFLKERGYDAFWMLEKGNDGELALNLGVYDANNIKSATGNSGTFDASTNDIRYSVAKAEDGSEFNRRLELYQMINYLTEQSKNGDKPRVLNLRILDGVRRGFYGLDIVESSGMLDAVNQRSRSAMLTHAQSQLRGEKITKLFSLSKRVIDNDLRALRETLPKDIPEHFVHEDYRAAPEHLVRDIENHGYENQVEALVDPKTGTIHIFAQNIGSRERLHRAFIEELMGHHGLSKVFGRKELDGLLNDILPSVEKSAAWKELIKTYTDIAQDLKSDNPATVHAAKLRATEELIAKQDVEQGVWDKVVAWIRAWMRQHGLVTNYTEGDIRRLMSMVHNAVMSGRQPHPWGVRNHPPRIQRPPPQYKPAPAYSAKEASALPMDKESRMARAREQGFDPDTVMYHGTDSELNSFDPLMLGKNYSDEASRLGFFFTSEREGAEQFGVNVKSVYLRRGRTVEVTDNDISDFVSEWIDTLPDDEAEFQRSTKQYQNSADIDKGLELAIVDAKERGYDSASVVDENGEEWVAIFDPKNIRSINAAFDPVESDSTKLLASLRPNERYMPIYGTIQDNETRYSISEDAAKPGDTTGRRAAAVPDQVFVAEGAAAPEAANRVKQVQTGTFRTGIKQATTPEDIAHIVAPLRKEAQETFLAVVTAKDGSVLSVIKHTVGGVGSSQVFTGVVGGAVSNTPNAKNVWFVHNHPSGEAKQSDPDIGITIQLDGLFQGSGIKAKGMVVVAPGGTASWLSSSRASSTLGSVPITIAPKARTETVPIRERKLRSTQKLSNQPINSSEMAADAMRQHSGGQSGVLLLDIKNKPLMFVSLSQQEMARMRTGDTATGTAKVLRAIDETNALVAIINAPFISLDYGAPDPAGLSAAQNFGSTLGVRSSVLPVKPSGANLKVLDILMGGYESLTSMGGRVTRREGSPFYSLRPKPADPFYSALTRTVERAEGMPKRGDPKAFIRWLDGQQKRGRLKKEERDWMGLDDWLNRHKNMTRDMLQEFVRDNQTALKEVVRGEISRVNRDSKYALPEVLNVVEQYQGQASEALLLTLENDGDAYRAVMKEFPELEGNEDWAEIVANDVAGGFENAVDTKFSEYQLPGGENYREMLLTLPINYDDLSARREAFGDRKLGEVLEDGRTIAEHIDELDAAIEARKQDSYVEGHYDEPNVLVHIRFNERTVNGKRILFIEEIQSDWHQEGRAKGYRQKPQKMYRLRNTKSENGGRWVHRKEDLEKQKSRLPDSIIANIVIEERDGIDPFASEKTPDAPFKKTWPMLAMKRMIRHASENGFDSVAWTTGEQQAERYDLSKQVDRIEYTLNDDQTVTYEVIGDDDFMPIAGYESASKEEVSDTVGKEVAERMFNDEGIEDESFGGGVKALMGEGLKIGGEGMIGFYDKMLVNNTNKFVKRWGSRVGIENISQAHDASGNAMFTSIAKAEHVLDAGGEIYVSIGGNQTLVTSKQELHDEIRAHELENLDGFYFGDVQPQTIVHSLDINDSMREAAHAGFPMYSLRKHAGDEKALSIINSKITKPQSERGIFDRVTEWMIQTREGIASGDILWAMKQGSLDSGASLERWEKEVFGELLDAQYSPYKMLNMTRNLPSVMAAISMVGIPAMVDGAFQPVAGRKGFVEFLRPLFEHRDGDLSRKFEGYAAARRSNKLIQKKNKDGTLREKLFNQEEIDELLALGEKYPIFEEVFNDWQQFKNNLLDLAVDRGVLSKEERDAWSDNDYVPFYRATESIEMVGQRTGRGLVKAGIEGQHHGIRRLHGSEIALGNIIENMWFNTASLIDKIYKNEAMERVVDLLEGIALKKVPVSWEAVRITNRELANALGRAGLLVGDPSTDAAQDANRGMGSKGMTPRGWLTAVENMSSEQKMQWSVVFRQSKPTAPNVVSVMREGKLVYFEVEDLNLLRTLKGMDAEAMVGLMRAMNISKNLLTKMVTVDPGFMLANNLRDTWAAWVTSDANFIPILDSIRAMGDIFEEKGDYIRFMMSGAGGGGFYDLTGGDISKVLKEQIPIGPKTWLPKLWRAYMKLGAVSENSNRLAIAKRVIQKGGSVAEGMHQGMDIMNFTMSGDYAAMKFLVRTYPFLNARIQGEYKLYRGARDEKKRYLPGFAGRVGVRAVGFMLKGLALSAVTLALLRKNWDDDDYERLEGWQKDIDWSFFVGGIRYTIPKPFEVGLLFATLPERFVRFLLGRDDLEASKSAFWRGISNTLAMNPFPQLIRPMVEEYANINMFTGNNIVPKYWEGVIAPERQFSAYTSETAKRIGSMMPGFMGKARSPKRIEHVVRAYTGTVGLYILNSVDWAIRQVDGDNLPALPSKKWYEKPVLNRIIKGEARTSRYNKYTDRLYEMVDAANEINSTIHAEIKSLRLEEARAFLEENKPLLAARPVLNRFRQAMREFSATERAIMNSVSLDGDEKRERLDSLNIKRNQLLSKAAPMLDKLRLQ